MTKKEWEKIIAARDILNLGEEATLAQIKAAFRRMSKKYHPDTAGKGAEAGGPETISMADINDAYQTLLEYCRNYRFPLVMDKENLDPEDWWMDRFGQDPLWGKQD